MKKTIFTKYFNINKSSTTIDDLNDAIIEQLDLRGGMLKKISPQKYKTTIGMVLSYEILETEKGYKILGFSKETWQVWIWLVFGLILYGVGVFFILFLMYFHAKKFGESITNAKQAFN